MTKKHYEAISQVLKPYCKETPNIGGNIAESLAEYFASENPRFDERRFLESCGLKYEEMGQRIIE